MAGLSRVVGIGPRVTLNGQEFQVRGKTNRFYAEVEAAILQRRGNPFEAIVTAALRGKLDGDSALLNRVAEVVAEKFRNWGTVSYRDYLDFLGSPEGDALTAFHCLRQDAKDLTLDDVREYLVTMKFKGLDDEAAAKEIKDLDAAIASASGETQSGNSNGQAKTDSTGS